MKSAKAVSKGQNRKCELCGEWMPLKQAVLIWNKNGESITVTHDTPEGEKTQSMDHAFICKKCMQTKKPKGWGKRVVMVQLDVNKIR